MQHGLEAEQEDNPTIAVHTEGWIPNVVSLRRDSNFKALGIKHSEHNDGQEHFQELRAMLQRTCMIIAKKRASPAAKLMALNSSVIPAAIYKGLYAPWSLKQFELLDVPISALLRKLPKTHPTTLHTYSTQQNLETALRDSPQKSKNQNNNYYTQHLKATQPLHARLKAYSKERWYSMVFRPPSSKAQRSMRYTMKDGSPVSFKCITSLTKTSP